MKCTRQRCQNLADGGLQPLVRVRDHQLRPAQAAPCQAAQELAPERLGLAVADRHAEHLAPPVGVDPDGDDDRHRDSPSIGRLRKVWTRSSISPHSRETWLLEMPSIPMARTRSSTERVEMPWT